MINISDFPMICRVCLHKGTLRSLEENSLEVLGEIANLNLTHQKGLPKNICIGCFKTLLEISVFIDRTKYNDMFLRYLLLNNQSNVNPELIELETEEEAPVVLSNNIEQSSPRSILRNSLEEIKQVNNQVDQECKIIKKIKQEFTIPGQIQSQVKQKHAISSNKNVKKDVIKIPEYKEHCQEQSVDKHHDNKCYISNRNKNEELGINQIKNCDISTETTNNDDIKKFNKTYKKLSIKQKCNSLDEFEVYDDDLNEIQLSEWSKIVDGNCYNYSLNKNKDIENWVKQVNEHKNTDENCLFNSPEDKHAKNDINNVKKYRISLCGNNKSKECQDDSNKPLEKKPKICCLPKNAKDNSKQKNISECRRVNLTCQLCSRIFSSKSSLTKHILKNVCVGFQKEKFLVYEENENFNLKENKPHIFHLKPGKDQGNKDTIYNGFTLQNIVKSEPLDIVIKSEPEYIHDFPNQKLKSNRQSEPLDDEILAIINQEFPPY